MVMVMVMMVVNNTLYVVILSIYMMKVQVQACLYV